MSMTSFTNTRLLRGGIRRTLLVILVTLVVTIMFAILMDIFLLKPVPKHLFLDRLGYRTSGHRVEAKARVAEENKNSQNYSTPKPILDWHKFFEYLEEAAGCSNIEMFGAQPNEGTTFLDGVKAVCLDDKVSPTPGSCIVLSFGMGNEWSFEEAMAEYGCKVYAFDPTIRQPDSLSGHGIHFRPLGLGGVTGVASFHGTEIQVIEISIKKTHAD